VISGRGDNPGDRQDKEISKTRRPGARTKERVEERVARFGKSWGKRII